MREWIPQKRFGAFVFNGSFTRNCRLIEAAEIISQEASNLGLDVVARTYQYDGKETIMD